MKRMLSFSLATLLAIGTFPLSALSIYLPVKQSSLPSEISVSLNQDNRFSLVDDDTNILNEHNITSKFVQDEHEFYKSASDNLFPDNFRLVLQDDNSVLPVYEVPIDLNSSDSYNILIDDWGYNPDSQVMKDIDLLIKNTNNNILSVTAYVTPNLLKAATPASDIVPPPSYTTTVQGKTVKTTYIKVDAVSGSGGQTVIRKGKNGVNNESQFKNVSFSLKSSRSYDEEQELAFVSPLTVFKFFGSKFIASIIKEWKDPSVSTRDYVNEIVNSTNIVRYTNVIEDGMEYTGCISNKVYTDCNLVYFRPGAGSSPETTSDNTLSETFTSSKYANSVAERTAVQNYLTGPVIDRIEAVYVYVQYPSGTKAYEEQIPYTDKD